MQKTANLRPSADHLEAMRFAMVDSQLRPNAVSDPRVIAAMASVARELFLDESLAAVAYADVKLPLTPGRFMNLPVATGRLLTAAALRDTDKVLLIGAAGGYTAAVLARIVASAVAVECDANLVRTARQALAAATNVTVVEGPLAAGHVAAAPYDVIVVDGAIEQLPPGLVDQLGVDGRLVTGLIDRGVCRLSVGHRTAGGFGLADFADFDAAVLPGFAPEKGFVF
ncbi:MAG: protein-L-isoaspartate O-methyltransferase [Sphingomonas sp.]|uniref:protein-L-isoaspartate O-methyltransferase family protein n=1 Tax=Sphingomonas sp. TaxID=28214 RepID=UPI00180D197F|nr:protein-L-isoaspartate O-methyltransferase [Sphingomonas sp.]